MLGLFIFWKKKLDGKTAEEWFELGLNTENPREALESYDRAIKINPEYEAAWCNRGFALDELGRYEEAVESYNKAVKINPEDEDAWCNRGNALAKLGRYEEAVESYDRALQIKPDFKEALENKKKLQKKLESKPVIPLALVVTTFKLNAGRRTQLTIKNNGNISAKDITLDFSGDVEVRLLSEVKQLEPGEEQAVELWLKPEAEGEIPLDVSLTYRDELDRSYNEVKEVWLSVGGGEVSKSPVRESGELAIKRGFSILPNNDIRFGVQVKNTTGLLVSDVEVILHYTRELFQVSDDIVRLGNLKPDDKRTAEFILKPLGCIHNEKIGASIFYWSAEGIGQIQEMRPKEVHCVCPYLRGKTMTPGEFSRLAKTFNTLTQGLNFQGISVEQAASLFNKTCHNVLHTVAEYSVGNSRVLYLAGESIGEKATYLLTVVIQEQHNTTQIAMQAYSDHKFGLPGFLSEISENIRHLAQSIKTAKEIGIIESKQIINIIDSVVQRTSFNTAGNGEINIEDSVVRRVDFENR